MKIFFDKILTFFKIQNIFLFVFFGYFSIANSSENSIILFIEKYPSVKIKDNIETLKTLSAKLKQPDYLWDKMYEPKPITSGVTGIMAIHLGNYDISDKDGKIDFPRTFQEPVVNLLITNKIHPAFMIAPATVHNWILEKNKPARLYEFRFSRDDETGLYVIQAKRIKLPKSLNISLNTIIIIADPKSVFVPLGATITSYSGNLVLPNIYIKDNFDFVENTLKVEALMSYFKPITSEYKPDEKTLSKIITNL